MEKNRITVFVAGNKLTLITEQDEKYVTDVASKVDTAIKSLVSATNMSTERCAVMSALDFCDDLNKAKQDLNEVKEQIKDYIEDSAKLREENEMLKAKIEKLKVVKNESVAEAPVVISEKAEKKEEKITAEDDLFFDEEVVENKQISVVSPQEKKEYVQYNNPVQTHNQNNKKRHEHNHVNPFKERFMKKEKQGGYTPNRQYSLFDKKD